MTQKEICRMCSEYDSEHRCDSNGKCKPIELFKENQKLKEENKSLKKQIQELRIVRSWDKKQELSFDN